MVITTRGKKTEYILISYDLTLFSFYAFYCHKTSQYAGNTIRKITINYKCSQMTAEPSQVLFQLVFGLKNLFFPLI
jgi:hypothetical protein